MTLSNLPQDSRIELLKGEINSLQQQLNRIEKDTLAFERHLKNELANEIIECQELASIHKKWQKEKKAKRLEQKKRGKNYVAYNAIIPQKTTIITKTHPDQENKKKKLYREAMLQVHPDKFSLHDTEQAEVASEVTIKLIDVYKNGTLEELQLYHAHIMSGDTDLITPFSTSKTNYQEESVTYLEQEIINLQKKITQAQESHLYHVLTNYTNPFDFVHELRVFYQDRLSKLRKRTRKVRK